MDRIIDAMEAVPAPAARVINITSDWLLGDPERARDFGAKLFRFVQALGADASVSHEAGRIALIFHGPLPELSPFLVAGALAQLASESLASKAAAD